ncbi:hypothetical protein K3495_g8634 [Podosphaera aphanis]|nr:hypothetical protein K3495_g8634 [Podosphaera aphanis]
MGKEEQIEEREVLDSIFPDEIHDLAENAFHISVLLDVINDNGIDTEPPRILLQVEYPPGYPEEAPTLDLLRPSNPTTHPFFNIAEDKKFLLDSLSETIEENKGMAMVFTLVSTLKDNAEQLIADRQSEWQQQQAQKLLEKEREENKKFHGTLVTPESFASWREAFLKEMAEIKKREEDQEDAAEKKRNRGKEIVLALTGKQLWMSGMVGKIEDDDDDSGQEAAG